MRRGLALIALALPALGFPLPAQSVSSEAGSRELEASGAELTISVLTFGQGDPIWERFGHNALRIRDARDGSDIAYNWGTFDFQQPNFLGRFLTGNTLYWLDTATTPLMVEYYERVLDRTAVEQVLALTPAQRVRVRDFVRWNLREENRNYRYDYFIDNCSTRLRDAIDFGVGGALKPALRARPSAHTFRSESLRLMAGMPLPQAGMHIALAEPADEALTAWEESFVPMRLMERLRQVRVPDGAGDRPLVASEAVLYASTREPEERSGPTLVGRFLVVGLLLAGLVVLLARRATRGGRRARTWLGVVGAAWGLLAGLMGVVLALAWSVTRHIFWYRNENLLQLAPLALLLVVAVPLALHRPRWRAAGLGLLLLLLGASVLGLVLKPLPM
ncbi:MAG TPA: DUF4105 domain-containing protein, partial [Gemmatimonadaceae bacterium]|nr:DUF4105 domain-containing protein [Gemmatimonadaceae bacterium]